MTENVVPLFGDRDANLPEARLDVLHPGRPGLTRHGADRRLVEDQLDPVAGGATRRQVERH